MVISRMAIVPCFRKEKDKLAPNFSSDQLVPNFSSFSDSTES